MLAALEKAFAESGGTTTAPERLQRDVGITRFVRGHAHERHRASGPEGHAGHVLLFRRIDDLKAGLHPG